MILNVQNDGLNIGTLYWTLTIESCERCNDSKLQSKETCDDGNSLNGDGCSDLCQIELDWFCVYTGLISECSSCGDGIRLGGGETCDDGVPDSEGCSFDCQGE